MLARVAAPNATHWLHFIVIYAIGNSPLFAQIRETRSTSKGFSVFCSQLQLSRIGFVSPFRKLGLERVVDKRLGSIYETRPAIGRVD
jgi:hypothetical protein